MNAFAGNTSSHLQVIIPALFIITACILPFIFNWHPAHCPRLALFVAFLGFVAACILFRQVSGSPNGFLEYFPGHSWSGERFLHSGQPIGIVLRTDLFASLLLVFVTGIGFLVTLYSQKYISHVVKSHKIGYYYTLLLLLMTGMVGICLTGDCFNFYVFLEVTSISSYALVVISGEGKSLEAGIKYMLVGAFGSILILFGIALLFSATGSLNMTYASLQVDKILNGDPSLANFRYIIFASLGLFITGLSIKSAFFPTHAWLADAHPAAPSSVSALLSGLVVKTTGAFLLIRFLFTVFGFHKNSYGFLLAPAFMVIAVATTIGGSIFAIAQNDIKRMLAFSTIAQMGYILIGISLLTPAGLEGSILHILNHALIKSLLFLCAGAVIYKTGIRDIRQMSGIGHRMPLTMGCFSIGALSIVGIPPLNGFMSKWALGTAAMEAKMPGMVVVLLFSSLLNAVYNFRVVVIAFFSPSKQKENVRTELPWEMAVPLVTLTFALVFFGIKVGVLRNIIKSAVQVLWR